MVVSSHEAGLNVLLVRHGESQNNPMYAQIFNPVAAQPSSSDAKRAAEVEWLARRFDDPALTAKGFAEAKAFASAYGPRIARSVGPSGRAHVFVSPFLRTCSTAAPIVEELGDRCAARVRPDLFEVGGCYTEVAGGGRGGPGRCLTAAEIEARFGYDVSALAAAGRPRGEGWYAGGWETDLEGRARAAAVADWLRSPELRAECANAGGVGSWAVLVMHGHFIDLLIKALLGTADDPAGDQPGKNTIFRARSFATPNASTAHFLIAGGRVVVNYIGRTEHLSAL